MLAIGLAAELTARQLWADLSHLPTAGLMLVHRLRRWTNIEPAVGEAIVFAGTEWHLQQTPGSPLAFLTVGGDFASGEPLPLLLPVNTKKLYDICTLLGQRLRRWADVIQKLYKCQPSKHETQSNPSKHGKLPLCWFNVADVGLRLK